MFKNLKTVLIFLIYINSGYAFAINSSSFLIANKAINFYDFDIAIDQFDIATNKLSEAELEKRLLALINLNLIEEAYEVSKEILKKDQLNQEAWVVYLTYAKIYNISKNFKDYQALVTNNQMDLLNYTFFIDQNIKEKNFIARSIFEVIQTYIGQDQIQTDYKFLLFYLSISNILDPNFNEAYFYIAQIYQILELYSKAEFYYKKINKNHSLSITSQKNIVINKSKQGFFEEGERILLKLINQNKNDSSLTLAIADLYRAEKKYLKAIDYYNNYINLSNNILKDNWRVYYLRGICYERLNMWELAEKDFLLSLEIKSESPQVLNYLAYGWIERNTNIDLALEMLTNAYKSNPNSYYILDSLAWAYFKKNNLNKALVLMEEVILMAPGESVSLDHLADIYFSLNRKREAYFFWKQALDLSEPEDKLYNKLTKKIESYHAG